MSKRIATDSYQKTTKLKRSIDDTVVGNNVGKRSYDTDSDDETTPQKKPNVFFNKPIAYPASGVKRSLHGTIYQLKLLTVFIVRALKNNYKFRLATEIDAADKFDDLVFQYQSGNLIENRFLQAKHKQDELKLISFSDLINERNDDFSLQKYFMSYQRIKGSSEFEGKLNDFILCTNINLDYDDLTRNNVKVDEITAKDDFFLSDGNSKKCNFRVDSNSDLYERLRECSRIYTLAKALASHVIESKYLTLKTEIFKLYHTALVKENVVNKEGGKFQEKFIRADASLSESAKKLRYILDKHFSKTNNGLTVENASLNLSKSFGIGFKLIPDPQIENVNEFVTELANVIKKTNKFETVKILKQKLVIKQNIHKLAGYVFVKKESQIVFSNKFLDINSKLCGNLEEFRTNLKIELETGNYDFTSLNQLTVNIFNFETCEEEQMYSEPTLPCDKIDDNEINDFFAKLIFAINQPNEIELSKIIEREMSDYSGFDLLDANLVADSFQIQILDWFKLKCGTWISNDSATTFLRSIQQKMIALISVGYNSYIETLKAFQIGYRNECEKLQQFLSDFDQQSSDLSILNFVSTEDTLLAAIKVLQTISGISQFEKIDSYIFMCLTTLLLPETRKRVITAFSSLTSIGLLIIECNVHKNIDVELEQFCAHLHKCCKIEEEANFNFTKKFS